MQLAFQTKEALEKAEEFKSNWRKSYLRWKDAKAVHDQMVSEARDLMPPLNEEKNTDSDED